LELRCTTFESPGLPPYFVQLALQLQPRQHWQQHMCTYLGAPNPINMLYSHLGAVTHVTIPFGQRVSHVAKCVMVDAARTAGAVWLGSKLLAAATAAGASAAAGGAVGGAGGAATAATAAGAGGGAATAAAAAAGAEATGTVAAAAAAPSAGGGAVAAAAQLAQWAASSALGAAAELAGSVTGAQVLSYTAFVIGGRGGPLPAARCCCGGPAPGQPRPSSFGAAWVCQEPLRSGGWGVACWSWRCSWALTGRGGPPGTAGVEAQELLEQHRVENMFPCFDRCGRARAYACVRVCWQGGGLQWARGGRRGRG
jgi:hypothetical protein